MKKIFKRTLSVILAVTMIFGTATLSGIVDIDLSEFIEMIPKAEASDGCPITNSYRFGDIFSGYYNSKISSKPCLVEGQGGWLEGQIQYVFCGSNSYLNTYNVSYEIKNSSGNTVYSSTSEGYFDSGVFTYDLIIPATLSIGQYTLHYVIPTICCDNHYCSYKPGISLGGETFNIVDADCPIETINIEGIFENKGFEFSETNYGAILYTGQDYTLQGKNQYVLCDQFYSSIDSSLIEYKIKGAWRTENYGVVYYTGTASQSIDYQTKIATYSIYIPNILSEGTYEIDIQFPWAECDGHEVMSDLYVSTVFNIAQSYTLSYDANGGNGAPSAQTNCNKYTIPSTVPTRFGYNFLGWSTNRNATSADYVAGNTINLSSDTTLYAVWGSVDTVSVGYSYTATISEEYGSDTFKFIPPSNGMYVFESSGSLDSQIYILDSVGNEIASDDDSGDSTNFRLETYLNAGTVYFAKVKAYSYYTGTTTFSIKNLEYTVTYDANGGAFSGNNQVKKYGESLQLSTIVPTKKGYDFLGWAVSSDSQGTPSDPSFYKPVYQPGDIYTENSDITLIAVWELHKYDLNFYITNSDGEEELYKTYSAYYGENISGYIEEAGRRYDKINANAPEGMLFSGWTYQSGTAIDFTKMPAASIKLFAAYEPKPIEVYVDYNTGNGLTLEDTMVRLSTSYELVYGENIDAPDESGNSYSDKVKSIRISDKCKPAEYMSLVDWKIYYVEEGKDPYDKANWKEGINADGTSIAKSTLIYSIEWGQVCGENITWSFNEETGELSITGTGEITDNPWVRTYGLKIKSVVVSEGITTINGLNNLPYVTEISLPESTEKIGSLAFTECISLKKIIIPENVTSIGGGAFFACAALEEITIPKNVTEIKTLTFAYCTNLEEIVIHKNIETIGDLAFAGSGIKRFIVDKENKNFVSDEYGVLYNKDMTELIAYPVGNERTMYTIPDGVETIKPAAFTGIGVSADLGEETFGNDNLKAIMLPDSVTTIGYSAFEGCQALEYVHIPSSVTTIEIGILDESTAYICSDTENCYAKTYADENGYTFKLCEGHEEHVHSYKETVIKAASCTEDGEIKYTCECLDAYTKAVKKAGHVEGEWEIVSEATKQSDGRKIKKCKTCGATVKDEVIPKLTDTESTTKPAEEPATKPVQPTTNPSQPTTKPAEPTTKPATPTTKPAQPTTKPSVPTTKPTEPATKPSFSKTCPYCSLSFSSEAEYNKHVAYENEKKGAKVDIRKPSQTEITYGDSIILHADVDKVPEGGKIVWTADNSNFTYSVSSDGSTCTITPASNGTTTFTATVVDKDGNVISSDSQTMTSKAGFFQKIIAFFKKLFGMTKVIPEAFKRIF